MRVAPINRDDECHLIVSCTLNWLEQKKGNKRREDKTRPLKESFKAPRIIFFIILKRKKNVFFLSYSIHLLSWDFNSLSKLISWTSLPPPPVCKARSGAMGRHMGSA